MKYLIDSSRKPLDIGLTLSSYLPGNVLRTIVYDSKTNDVLLERTDVLKGTQDVILKLPVTSDKIIVETFSREHGRLPLGKDKTFSTGNLRIMPLKKYNVSLGSGDVEFLKFAEQFCKELPSLKPDGKLRRSPSGRFKFVLFDKLRSHKGELINSPCMVGKKTGTIEISKDYFMRMSLAQRMAVLCHEYGHFYKNPLSGYDIGNEYGADLNGMTVFIGSGYGLSEYINAFKKVFNGAKTNLNRNRYSVMKGFAKKIFNGEYFGKPYNL